MNPIRVITKLNAKTQTYSDSGGGISIMDSMHCAVLCKGIERKYLAAALIKWGGEWADYSYLEKMLWIKVARLAAQKKWKVPAGKELLRRLSKLAIYEMAYELKHNPDSKQRDGRAAQRIKLINGEDQIIDSSLWARTWQPRYEEIFTIISAWADIALGKIRHNQKEVDVATA